MQNDLQTNTSQPQAFAGVTKEKTGTLRPALRTIPKSCFDRPTYKGVLLVTRAIALWVLSLAILFSTDNPFILVLGWIFGSLALAGMFVVGHDAAHGSLFNSKKLNKVVGRFMFLPELHSYEAWLLGHNRLHHGHTVREQMDFVWHPTTKEQYDAMTKKERLQHRLEWSFLGAGFYYIRNVWWNKMISFTPPERYRDRIRKDTLFVAIFAMLSYIVLFIFGALQYGSFIGGGWMVLKILGVPWFGFMTIIGWTVYVHHISPDIKWWPRNQWDSFKGQIEGTTILHINPVVNYLFFHNIFIHVPHHVDMRIPCYKLKEAGKALSDEFPEIKNKKFKISHYVKNTKVCKLYDFESHIWQNYKGKVTSL